MVFRQEEISAVSNESSAQDSYSGEIESWAVDVQDEEIGSNASGEVRC